MRVKRPYRIIRGVLAAVGLVVAIVSLSPVTYWYATQLAGVWEDPAGEVLIVLGASAAPDGILAVDTHRRANYAVLAWRGGGFRKVVVCGAGLARPIRDFLVQSGVPADRIVMEDVSRSTRENALEAKRRVEGEGGRKVLLTSDFHMFRARRAFAKAGLDVLPRPIPDVRQRWFTPQQRWVAFLDLAEETAKIVYYWALGWI